MFSIGGTVSIESDVTRGAWRSLLEMSAVRFFVCNILYATATAKICEDVNRKLPVGWHATTFLTLYTNPERHNIQHYRQTDDITMPRADHTVYKSTIG